jgi:hypothetical protein
MRTYPAYSGENFPFPKNLENHIGANRPPMIALANHASMGQREITERMLR